ncbi:MAG: hypothetical protein JWO60_2297, partial [Frankiales bacterium]|nr:hypothetical protein [Frankiales bacterium]
MPSLVLGPLLRCVTSDPERGGAATVWVETDAPCTVRVRAGEVTAEARTVTVSGHHFGVVVVRGLPERGETAYAVELDDDAVWPVLDAWPESVIRTRRRADPVRLAFGSCRVAGP